MTACFDFDGSSDPYRTVSAGLDHSFFVIFKGFSSQELLRRARGIFRGVTHAEIHVDDDSFDIGAYGQSD